MKRGIVVIATAGLIALTGCSSNTDHSQSRATKSPSYASAPSTVARSSESAEKKQGKTNERGNVEKVLGEKGALFDADTQQDYFSFTVNSITPNYQCTASYAKPPQNGQFLAINITVVGGPEIAKIGGLMQVSPHDFQVVGLDGVVENGIQNGGTYGCVNDTEAFPMQGVGQGVTGTGTVVVDTKNAAGYLVFRPGVGGGSTGWEYKF